METREYVENAISNLEKHLNSRITIIDREGLFRFKQKAWVFNQSRSTHQVMECCRIGFGSQCIGNCRYRINALCIEQNQAHYTACWKGLGQIAIPLRCGNVHYGVLYCGCFRDPGIAPAEDLPEEFYKAYNNLPEISETILAEYIPVLHIFAQGLIAYLREENIVNDEYDFRVSKLYEFLHNNYQRNIGLSDAAEVLELSDSYASSFIKLLTGYNFVTLLKNIRIEHAKTLLVTTDCNLRSIAGECGFANEFHFSKVFKSVTGISPSRFRVEH